MAAYFDKSYIQFFKSLEKNNNKDWFDQNRAVYENQIKKPFEIFTKDLAEAISAFDPEVSTDYKNAIFRINRDIRFAKDKSPYKLNRSCAISKYGKKDHATPGYYVEISAHKIGLAGGAWAPTTAHIASIRQEIAYNMKAFDTLVKDKKFINAFGDIKGERLVKAPKGFEEEALTQPLILNKEWYYWVELSPELIISDALLPEIIKRFKTILPLNQFLRTAMGS
jgi:uncharacterized protein (TIGR02453 family)